MQLYLIVPNEFKNDPITSAYASDMEDLIRKYEPDYWIHGHIHTLSRYCIGKTEIICNPHGNIDEPFNGFNRELLIEV